MAIFNSSTEDLNDFKEDILINTPSNGAIISKCMSIEGDLKSCEPIVVSGQIKGNIVCEDIVVVLNTGRVEGKIEAKEVRVDGKLEGPIEALVVELTKGAKQEGYILSTTAIINGELDGDIIAKESLEIGKDAKVTTYECKADTITIEGDISGLITANKLLDVRSLAKVRGEISTKELNSELGSQIIGSIKTLRHNNIINKNLKETNSTQSNQKHREIRRIG